MRASECDASQPASQPARENTKVDNHDDDYDDDDVPSFREYPNSFEAFTSLSSAARTTTAPRWTRSCRLEGVTAATRRADLTLVLGFAVAYARPESARRSVAVVPTIRSRRFVLLLLLFRCSVPGAPCEAAWFT